MKLWELDFFSLSLTGSSFTWFSSLPSNSIRGCADLCWNRWVKTFTIIYLAELYGASIQFSYGVCHDLWCSHFLGRPLWKNWSPKVKFYRFFLMKNSCKKITPFQRVVFLINRLREWTNFHRQICPTVKVGFQIRSLTLHSLPTIYTSSVSFGPPVKINAQRPKMILFFSFLQVVHFHHLMILIKASSIYINVW